MPGLRFQHFSVAVSQGKKNSLKKCSMFLADESVVLTQIRRVFLDALQADANPRIHKAAGSLVWVHPSSREKASQDLQGEPPGCTAGAAPQGGFWRPRARRRQSPELQGRAPRPPGRSTGSAVWKASAARVAERLPSLCGLRGADRAGEQRGGSRSQATCAASVQQAPRIHTSSLQAPQSRNS